MPRWRREGFFLESGRETLKMYHYRRLPLSHPGSGGRGCTRTLIWLTTCLKDRVLHNPIRPGILPRRTMALKRRLENVGRVAVARRQLGHPPPVDRRPPAASQSP